MLREQFEDSLMSVSGEIGGGNGGCGDDEEQTDSLLRLRGPSECCDTLWSVLTTCLLLLDIVAATGLFLIYAINEHYVYFIVGVSVFTCTSLIVSLVYATQMRQHAGQSVLTSLACLVINIPLQLGIMAHRITQIYKVTCGASCCKQHHKTKMDSNIRWVFIKLDLIHGVMNCTPQMIINIQHILVYRKPYMIQYIALVTSFTLLLIASVMHEKVRKERARNSPFGSLPMLCILTYRAFIFSARIIAFSVFCYYFGVLIGVVILPHFIIVIIFFTYLYRQAWKVQYSKILTNSICCILAYFPLHCEYRPEGEIVLYYLLYLIQNIIMVGLAFAREPFRHYSDEYKPWSEFHKTSTALVLLFSSIGLVFMGIYYFFFHGANGTISDTNLKWLARVCEWKKRPPAPARGLCISSTNGSFTNPLCLDPQNVTSPVWTPSIAVYPGCQQRQSVDPFQTGTNQSQDNAITTSVLDHSSSSSSSVWLAAGHSHEAVAAHELVSHTN